MAQKYIPTIKDLKASQRFQQKQNLPKSTFKKPALQKPVEKPAPSSRAGDSQTDK